MVCSRTSQEIRNFGNKLILVVVVAKYSLHPFVQSTPCNQYTDAIGFIYVYSRRPTLSYFSLLAVVVATLLFTDRASECRMPRLLYDEERKSGCHYK
jgi:hypothetical protein